MAQNLVPFAFRDPVINVDLVRQLSSTVLKFSQESNVAKSLRVFAVASLLAAVAVSASAGPAEVANSAASQASAVATKVEGAVKRGVQKAASAVEHGASVAGRAVNKTAQKLGLPASAASASQ